MSQPSDQDSTSSAVAFLLLGVAGGLGLDLCAKTLLANQDRVNTVHALADVFRIDKAVSVLEIDFFNGVAGALQVTPAEVAGLVAGKVD